MVHRGQQPTCSMPGLAAGLLGTIMTSTVPEQGLLHALSALVLVEPAGSSLTAGASRQPTAKGAACACSTEDGDRGLPRGLTGVAAVLFGSPWKLWPFAGRPKGDGVGPSPDCRLKLPLTCSLPAHRWDQLSWASCGAQCWRVRAFGTEAGMRALGACLDTHNLMLGFQAGHCWDFPGRRPCATSPHKHGSSTARGQL